MTKEICLHIISREDARNLGITRYLTGKSCVQGHFCQRMVRNHECVTCMQARIAAYRKANKAQLKEYAQRYRDENRDVLKERQSNSRHLRAIRQRQRMNTPHGKATTMMYHILRRALSDRDGVPKEERLGYTPDDLKRHLEKQFKKRMTWENYGDWHIDHIIPIKKFLDDGVTDPGVINALSNLKPEWAIDNLKKGERIRSLL